MRVWRHETARTELFQVLPVITFSRGSCVCSERSGLLQFLSTKKAGSITSFSHFLKNRNGKWAFDGVGFNDFCRREEEGMESEIVA